MCSLLRCAIVAVCSGVNVLTAQVCNTTAAVCNVLRCAMLECWTSDASLLKLLSVTMSCHTRQS